LSSSTIIPTIAAGPDRSRARKFGISFGNTSPLALDQSNEKNIIGMEKTPMWQRILPASIVESIEAVGRMQKRQLLLQALNLAIMGLTVLMCWKLLAVASDNGAPVMAVLSESMSPAFERGDVLYVARDTAKPISAGDIVVFNIKGRGIPIVHRVVKIHEHGKTGKQYILTKGDNNDVHDRGLYNRGQKWLHYEDLVGRVKVYVPFVGMPTIFCSDYPQIKYLILSLVVFFGLITREE
jgi:signal peptidase